MSVLPSLLWPTITRLGCQTFDRISTIISNLSLTGTALSASSTVLN